MKDEKVAAPALPLVFLAMLASGCSAGPSLMSPGPVDPYEKLAAKAAVRAPAEEFRLLLKRVQSEESASALQLLRVVELPDATQSQRIYARLLIERKLASGSLRGHAAELHRRLALSWHLFEPRNLLKVKANLEALAEIGMTPEMVASKLLRDLALLSGAQMSAGAKKDGAGRTLSHGDEVRWTTTILNSRDVEVEATVWGGGQDRLLRTTGVLAFLANDLGEPMLYGRQLWIRNESSLTVAYSAPTADVYLRELGPGEEELIPLRPGTKVATGVDVKVRSARLR